MSKINKINTIIKPNTSPSNKTGSWRTHKPITDLEICIGCSLCAKVCPDACILMAPAALFNNKLKPITDYDYCKGCALCVRECPVKAIKMVEDY
ncbi:MAG: 4Fe-4S dicluster-binding protein [Patescibacteria group bacterium]